MPEPQSENIDLIALTRALVDIDSTSGREGAVAAERVVQQVDEVRLGPGLRERRLDGADGGRRGVDEGDAGHVSPSSFCFFLGKPAAITAWARLR